MMSEMSLLLSATDAAHAVGVSRSGFWKLHASARLPAPVRLGRRVLWRRSDLKQWVEQGCPSRERFEAMRGVRP